MNAQTELVSGGCAGRSRRRCRLEEFDRLFQLGVPPVQGADLRGGLANDPVTTAVVDLLLADPVPQRFGVHSQPFRHRRDRRPLARIVLAMLTNQTDGLGPRLRVIPARHELHLHKKGGAHQTSIKRGTVHHACFVTFVSTRSMRGCAPQSIQLDDGVVSRRFRHVTRRFSQRHGRLTLVRPHDLCANVIQTLRACHGLPADRRRERAN
jgi:hypothetical protein